MPGSGKSSVGRSLAEMLGCSFIDTDILIQNKNDTTLEAVVNSLGTEAFLNIERDVCCSLDVINTVIATGGSVVYRERSMKHLSRIGTIVYLKVGLEKLNARLIDMKQRGVVFKKGQTLDDIYNERIPLYEKYADIIINEDTLGFNDTVLSVYYEIKQYNKRITIIS